MFRPDKEAKTLNRIMRRACCVLLMLGGGCRPTVDPSPTAKVSAAQAHSSVSEPGKVSSFSVRLLESDIDHLNRCLQSVDDLSLSGCMHYLHVYGLESYCRIRGCGPAPVPAVDMLLNPAKRSAAFDGLPVYAKTRYGTRFCPHNVNMLSKEYANVEAHPGQGFSVLASLRIPASTAIRSKSGQSFIVQSIIRESARLNFEVSR